MGEWERADSCVFYLNVAIHHEVTRELTSHLRRLIMDPPLWIWLISSLFQIYYTLGPKSGNAMNGPYEALKYRALHQWEN